METLKTLRKKKFIIYGCGITGASVIQFFKKNKIKNFNVWDDNQKKNNLFYKKINSSKFLKLLYKSDYIVKSPGININLVKFKKHLIKNKHKIISDLDLFYIKNSNSSSIVVTGTNGKSTTCKIIEHLLKKNGYKVKLGGNIGDPVLNIKNSKDTFSIIEASSFQLAYSKFIKPKYALIINISNDHLDWHGKMQNYLNSKFKIFKFQKKNDIALLKEKRLIKKFKREKYLSK